MFMQTYETRRGEISLPLLAGAGILVVFITAAVWWYFNSKSTLPADQGQVIVEEFLQQLRAGKTDQAWSATAADFKSYLGREAFRSFVGKHPELKQPLEFQAHSAATAALLPEYIYQTTAGSAKNKTPRTVKIRLVREAELWKVESLAVQ